MPIIFPKKHPRFVTLCGQIFQGADPAYFPRAEHRGRTIRQKIWLASAPSLVSGRSSPTRMFSKESIEIQKRNGPIRRKKRKSLGMKQIRPCNSIERGGHFFA